MWRNWFKPRPEKAIGKALYAAIVQAARQASLYGEDGVPDTLEGRLELILLHAALTIRVLRRDGGEPGRLVSQVVFDTMFEDFDIAMRELGLGDSGVGKKIRFMAEGFYGRAQGYATALDDADPAALEAVLARNLLASERPDPRAAALASHVQAVVAALDATGGAALSLGERPVFPSS
ncbi:ubiquinol-cytochrome C chaperone family protein [uncultured Maricaulis sp.]|uniref:ubiquinol-cytochrome C chaperone family protein n=1 Tax=uncultured Maricaulis sp. TaxID=174710 RepID=UPI0030D72AA9|tara:strand:+ start:20372 stop:20905 length:534 start_codon:yes stop_codon:yes gene_type:complete